jgi:mannose-1-phosphate guanylyltransferase
MIHPVIMAGGTGSRLWPLSRQLNPKQFLKLTDNRLSMLQLTVARLNGMESADPLLICNEDHRFLAAEQMRQSGYKDAHIILEPCGRNTAPAIALAALQLVKNIDEGQDPLMLVLAADHLIKDTAAFQNGIAGQTGDLRYCSGPCGNGLWLYPARAGAGRRQLQCESVCGKT